MGWRGSPFARENPGPWRAPGIPRIPTNISLSEAQALRDAAYGICLEIGSAFGFSTVLIALRAQHVVAVDPHREFTSHERLLENLRAYGVETRVRVVQARSQDYAAWVQGSAAFDFAFIDGDHSYATAAHDIQAARRLVKPGGRIAVHDYSAEHWPSVVKAVDDWLAPAAGRARKVGTLYVHELSGRTEPASLT